MLVYFLMLTYSPGANNFPLKDCFTKDLDLLIILDSWKNEFSAVKEILKYLTLGQTRKKRILRLAIKHSAELESVLDFHRIGDYREINDNFIYTTEQQRKQKMISNFDLDKCVNYFDTHSKNKTIRLAIWIVRCVDKRCSHKLDQNIITTRLVTAEMNMLFLVFADGNIYNFIGNLNIQNILKLRETTQTKSNQLGIKLCGRCKEGWIDYRSKGKPLVQSCYYISDELYLIKVQAEKVCIANYSTLLNIETYEEFFFLQQVLTNVFFLQKKNIYGDILIHTGHNSYYWSNKRPIMINKIYNSQITQYSVLPEHTYINVLQYIQFNDTGGGIVWRILPDSEPFLVFCEEFINDILYNIPFEPNRKSKPKNVDFLFECRDESANYVHYNEVCDGVIHCENSKDEEYCHYNHHRKIEKINLFHCQKHDFDFPSIREINRNSVCNRKRDCLDGSDEINCYYGTADSMCSDGTYLPRHWLDEGNNNCKFKFQSDLDHNSYTYPRQLQFGIIKCNPSYTLDWAPRCVHLRMSNGNPMGCSDMSHLENCENFNCSTGLVKCPHSYCIPLYYVDDQMMDCVYGEDESNDVIIDDINLRMCLRSNSKVTICDGKTDCDNMADELDCHSYCADGFKCQAGVVVVDGYNKSEPFKHLSRFDGSTKVFQLSGVNLSLSSSEKINKFQQLLELHMSGCSVHDDQVIDFKETNYKLYRFDASFNNLTNVTENGMFSKLKNLLFLNLSHNTNLETVDPRGIGSNKIISIDFSYTKITFLPENWMNRTKIYELYLQYTHIYSLQWIPISYNLIILNIQNTYLKVNFIGSNYYKNATITGRLLADNYKLCCPQVTGPGIPQHVCGLANDAISSCDDLIGDMVKRTLLWTMAIAALVGNASVIIFRVCFNRTMFKLSYGIFVTSLGVSDFIMGVYLLIIASVDIFYQNIYVLHESVWRHSSLCKFSGFLSTFSSESSVFFVLLITLDRFLAMNFPYGQHKFTKLTVNIATSLAWTFAFLISLIPIIYPEWLVYSTNGMCLGLPLTGSGDPGWRYSMAIFIVLNFLMFVLIAVGQVAIYRSLGDRKKISVHFPNRRENDIDVAKQLFIIAVTDFLCWFPISVLGLLSVKGQIVSQETYAWLIVFVLPLNSAVNPMIYTVPMIYKKWTEFRKSSRDFSGNTKDVTNLTLM